AARLLAPYCGTSLYVWGVLIGLVLVYLSAGYVLGGRLADRHPRPELLFQLTAWAGLWIGIIPLLSYPILLVSQQGFKTLDAGLVLGTLLAVLALFAVPVVLLGCVSPFAIRLLLQDVKTGGNTAGAVYALSTAGSILGTFLPVFWFIPTYGTRPTLVGFSLALLVPSVLGLWPVPRRRWYAALALVVVLAGGTSARQDRAAFGDAVDITGVEIDPDVVDVGRRYFHLDATGAHVEIQDARYWLATRPATDKYDVIVMDAYRQPYIPFHLTTREFFSEVRDHLRPGGVAVVNAGRTASDYRLVDAIASTMAAVYSTVFLVDVPAFNNTLIYGTTEPVTLQDVEHNLRLVSEPVAQDVAV